MKKSYLLILSALLLSLSGCNHKDLVFDERVDGVEVVFDWRNAPDADPESMAVYFYNDDSSSMRFIFQGRDGGEINIPSGHFCALGMNSDDMDWAKLRNSSTPDGFETYTSDAPTTRAYGLSTRAIPRASGTEDERVAMAPGMLWTDRRDDISISHSSDKKIITFYPEEAVCHYTVDIYDVNNLEYVDRSEIDGLITGMAEGYMHGADIPADEKVSIPFTLQSDIDAKTLHSEFLTFGEPGHDAGKHFLTIYLYLRDGSKWYYTFDVTAQIHVASDPHHVHIVLTGLPLPKPIMSGGGIIPNVNDWQSENIDVKM